MWSKNKSVLCSNSQDDSLKIAKKYDIKIISSHQHLGVAEARNKGSLQSKGDYLIFLDGDDWLYDENVLDKVRKIPNELYNFLYSEYNERKKHLENKSTPYKEFYERHGGME